LFARAFFLFRRNGIWRLLRHCERQRSNPFAPYHSSFRDAPLGAGFDVQLHIEESILTMVVMDSGFSPAGCPGMTMMMVIDSFSNSQVTIRITRVRG
jgi:hypothetical protein